NIISNVMPINSVSSRDGRLPCHAIINDDFRESGKENSVERHRQLEEWILWIRYQRVIENCFSQSLISSYWEQGTHPALPVGRLWFP
nr:hypothetical protein [Tanacetum cinerariifolium]